jgi:FMN phosphatase YigB (HAD superfamily)
MNNYFHRVIFFDLGLTLVGSDSKQWNPGAQTVLSQLRSADLRLGVISNTGNLTRADLEARLPPDFKWSTFISKLILLSSEVGIEKPDLRIFRLAVERAGISAEKCLYCSEDLLETLAAQRVGMAATRVLPPPKSDLKTLPDRLKALSSLQ